MLNSVIYRFLPTDNPDYVRQFWRYFVDEEAGPLKIQARVLESADAQVWANQQAANIRALPSFVQLDSLV